MSNILTRLFLGRYNPTNVYRYLFVDNSFRGDFKSFREAQEQCADGIASTDYAKSAVWANRALATELLSPNEIGVLFILALIKPRTVLDIGGGHGNFYWLAKHHIEKFDSIWHVVETAAVAHHAPDDIRSELHYTDDLDGAIARNFDLVIINNALHIMSDPYRLADTLTKFDRIILGDIPVTVRDRITITSAPLCRRALSLRFPVWIFSKRIIDMFAKTHRARERWLSGNVARIGLQTIERSSYFFDRKVQS